MSFRSPSLLARRILAATAIAAAAGAVLPATANADVTPTTLVNGVLSTVGGCQTPSRDAILAQRGATSAVVVTSPDHLQRAMVDFRVAVGGRIPIAGVVAP